MRYFTRTWHSGELSDAEAEAVPKAYLRHLASIRTALPAGVQVLAEGVHLHDALIRRVALEADAREVRLELRCGDNAMGYEDIAVTYVDAEVAPAALMALRDAASDEKTKLLYDEIDVLARRRFSHRVLFWPYREVHLTFSDVVVERTPVAGRDRVRPEPRWIEI